MTESELYKNLSALTKSKDQWVENIPYVASLLSSESTKIKAKALWLLGEMGLKFPIAIKDSVPAIAAFCDSAEPLLRERAVNALGRIGRGCYSSVEPYWNSLFRFAHDEESSVRLAFIWASENIATNTPDPYKDHLPLFAELLHDSDDRVRMEAPEIFRVLGKRRPEFVRPYAEPLQKISETDNNRVVRIHCLGAPVHFCSPFSAVPRPGPCSEEQGFFSFRRINDGMSNRPPGFNLSAGQRHDPGMHRLYRLCGRNPSERRKTGGVG